MSLGLILTISSNFKIEKERKKKKEGRQASRPVEISYLRAS